MPNVFSFPPFRRIRTQPDFQSCFRNGKKIYKPYYILYYRQNGLAFSRMGVITSKKNLRRAVRRNQAKRIARETFRRVQASLGPKDLVIVAQKKANDASKEELRRCLEQLFAKLRES